ncbi:hypothetical protein OC861_004795 [Tilletia horrida]|nr:hypothetical protein OC861_004795 [Tilletia horrida]
MDADPKHTTSSSPSTASTNASVAVPSPQEKDQQLLPPSTVVLQSLTRHASKAPLFLYLFSFCEPISFRSFRTFISHPKTLYVIGFLCALCSAVTIPALDLNYGYWVQRITRVDITNEERTYISNRTAWIAALLGLANCLFTTTYFTVFCLASERMSANLRETYVAATLSQDVSYFDLHGPGEVASRLSKDVNQVRVAFGEKTAYLTYGVANMIVALCFAFGRSAKVAGIIFCVLPVNVGVFAILGMLSERIGAPASAIEGQVATYLEQMLSSPRIVQAFSMNAALIARLDKAMLTPLRYFGRRRAAIRGAELAFLFFLIFGIYAVFFAWGGFLISHGYTSVGAATTAFWSAVNSVFGLANVVPHVPGIINGFLSLKSLRTTIERRPKIDVRDDTGLVLARGTFKPSFELKDVTFAYAARPSHASLRNVSLVIEPGKMTALVGPSGSGKSTIASLLIREADPETSNVLSKDDEALVESLRASAEKERKAKEKAQGTIEKRQWKRSKKAKKEATEEEEKAVADVEAAPRVAGHGEVFFAGHDVRTLNLKWLRSQIAVVQQHPQLFTGTVFANVAAGLINTPHEWIDEGKKESELTPAERERYSAIRAKVQSALEKAQAWEFVQKLPQGIDTVISGGRTGVLSGGQKQRVAIARALVSEPIMLCLDEATSALDSSTEERIRIMLEEEQKSRGMTVVTIAHRLSTIEKADSILVIHQGDVVDEGTHDELMQKGRKDDTYRRMVLRQRAVAEGDEVQDLDNFASGTTDTDSADALTQVASPTFEQGVAQQSSTGPEQAQSSLGSAALAIAGSPHGALQRINSRSASTPQGHHEPSSPLGGPRRRFHASSFAGMGSAGLTAVPVDPPTQMPTDTFTVKRLWRTFWIRARPQLSFFVVGCVAAVVIGCAFPLISWLTGKGIASLGLPDPVQLRHEAYKWSLYLLLIAACVLVVAACQGFLEVASDRTLRLFQRDTLASLLSQEIGWFDAEDQASGGLTAALTSHPTNVGTASGVIFGQSLTSVINILGSVLLAFLLTWRGAVVELSPLILVAFFSYANVVYLERYETAAAKPVKDGAAYMSEQIDSIRTVAALGRQEAVMHTFKSKNVKMKNRIKHLVIGAFGYSMTTAAMLLIASLVFFWSGVLLNRGQANNQEVFGGMEAVIVGSFSLMRFASLLPDFARAVSSLKVLTEWLDRVPKIAKYVLVEDDAAKKELAEGEKALAKEGGESDSKEEKSGFGDETSHDIVLTDIEMRYPRRPDHPALKNLNLRIKAGETTAFVGTSGSGKSSILNLLSRFYDPSAGSITFGGVDIRALPMDEWRSKAALVSQDPVLYEGSVRWNLSLGAVDPESVTEEQLRFACEQACILDFILSLPAGFEEDLGMKGMNLSGGQKQRLCIARALLRRPEILFLDEATSALDAESEATVQLALERAAKGRTTVVIAHRLSTIRKADTIHVVEDGRIVESGSHLELLERKGRYLELIEAQL